MNSFTRLRLHPDRTTAAMPARRADQRTRLTISIRLQEDGLLALATARTAADGATLSFPRVPAKVPSPSDLPTFVIAVCHHGESHKQHADAAISMAETRTPPNLGASCHLLALGR